MRSLILGGVLALVLASLVTNGFGADNAAPLPTLVKVTMRDGQVYIGELKPQRSRTYVVVTDLVTGKEQKLIKALVDRVDQPVSDDEVAAACGIDVLTAWKARAIGRNCMSSSDVGKIARIDDGTIFITGNQAAVDDKLQVYQTTQITDPDTKKVIGIDTKILAELRVTDVSSGFIKAEPDGGRPRLQVGLTVRTEPEPLPVVTFAADSGSAGEADKLALDQIAANLADGDVPVADAAQTAAAMAAANIRPADGVNPTAMQKLGQKMGASAIIVAHASGGDGGVQITVINVATGATAMSQSGPAPASIKNSTTLTLTVSMHVDGKDAVEIRPDSLTVHHLDASPPENIKINGIAVQPGRSIDNKGPTAYLSPKADIASARLVSQSGRGKITLDHGADGEVTVTFDDPDPGSADYSATVQFQEKGSRVAAVTPPAIRPGDKPSAPPSATDDLPAAITEHPAPFDRLDSLLLTGEKHFLTPGANNSLLLLEGDRLRRLGRDGFTVEETLHLPKSYEWIGERAKNFVALSEQNKCLDFIDKSTLKVRKSLQMQYFRLHDLCLLPDRDISYVMVEKSTGDGLEPQILIVNETTGDVHEPDDFGGTWGKVSPDGKKLYVAYKDIYKQGDHLLFNPDHIDVVPDYGNIDILMVYDISRPSAPSLISAKNDAGANGFAIAVSADGTKVSYLSFVGYPLYSKDIAAWDPTDLTKRPVSYPTKDNKGDCKCLAFHPILPIAAAPAENGAVCFDQNTGELQPDRLDFGPAPGEVKVNGLIFSPQGKNLILDCVAGDKFFLRRVKVNLSADELKQVERGPITPFDPRPRTGPVGPKASGDGSPSAQFALQCQQ
jgi:hypothetical protein